MHFSIFKMLDAFRIMYYSIYLLQIIVGDNLKIRQGT